MTAPDFDALLEPHRSLSQRGFVLLMVALAAVSFAAGMVFLLLGAWPIFGFFGLDVVLVYVAFRLNYRAGRMHERVQIVGDELRFVRVAPNGTIRSWVFHPHWVRVQLGEPEEGHPLSLTSHGRNVAVGQFLTAEERADFAAALGAALQRYRTAPTR